ncbi:hypothetical protein TNCV_1607651 [Trichonephila clavipes]|nr:hypothetical protein TNCV_1607651 [Trichonephila clavipes]
MSVGVKPTRTTQPASRIRTLTSTPANLRREVHERTTHWLMIDAEIKLVLSWLGVQTALLNIRVSDYVRKHDFAKAYKWIIFMIISVT